MKKTIKIEGMSCGHCAGRVKKELENVSGVKSARIDPLILDKNSRMLPYS